MKKMIIWFLVAAVVFIGGIGLYALREIGKAPSEADLKAYEKLAYFKNGDFQSPQKMVYDFDNVRNGPAGWLRFLTRSPFAPKVDLPQVKLNRGSFPAKAEDFAFYWLGHSTALMEVGGVRFLFDPVFGNAAPIPLAVPRYVEAPIKRSELPNIDYVVITHNHYDHLERASVQALKNKHFIVPLGVGAALKGWGVKAENITELGWGDVFNADGVRIAAEPTVHYSSRGLGDRNKTLWNAYVVQSDGKNIYWSGDSGYGAHFAEMRQKYGAFDLAIIEIDGWNTGWPNTHMFPEEIIRAATDLDAQTIVPVHWAVFDLALHPWHESIDMVLNEAQKKNVTVLTPKMGEKLVWGQQKTEKWW